MSELSKTQPRQSSAVIRVIGDRGSGKTAYMASLARWPNADPQTPVQTVTPIGEAGEDLVAKAQNILEQGLELEATKITSNTSEIKDYTLSISLKGQLSWKNFKQVIGKNIINLNISCRDYSGEFFADLLQKTGDPLLEDYIEDCLQATGILLLFDGSTRRKDVEYAAALDKFFMALDRKDMNVGFRRIALVVNKCEQPELWVNRDKPEFLATACFPQVCQKLKKWQEMGGGEINYFTASAFGMLGKNHPQPNVNLLSRSRGGVSAVIKDPKRWRPFGLVAPIYWMCTGDRHKKLD
ncbi:MAG: hypothetical protein F6K62_15045 [Sphaerospermopsis sp. SIO1G2]|nr:hypothetical protein [Sphaerospermopsis sp. SIO1G2]